MSTTTEPKISTAKLLFIMATELIIKLDEFEDSNLFKRNMKRTAKAFKAELEKWTDAVYENFKDSKELNKLIEGK